MLKRKAKIFKAARGFFGRRKNCWTIAVRAVHKAWQYAYIGRKQRKREFRSQWIQRINAASRQHGLGYSALMKYLPLTGIGLNRKVMSELAVTEPYSFKALVEAARTLADRVTVAGGPGGGRAGELR